MAGFLCGLGRRMPVDPLKNTKKIPLPETLAEVHQKKIKVLLRLSDMETWADNQTSAGYDGCSFICEIIYVCHNCPPFLDVINSFYWDYRMGRDGSQAVSVIK